MDDDLQEFVEGIWIVSAPHSFLGLHVGTRMTVIRLPSGKLVLHSPVPTSIATRAAIAELGPVAHIVCPNLFHHMYAEEAVAAFPAALLHGPADLWRKRRDLPFGAELSETPHPDWKGVLLPLTIQGCLLRETVFFHPATRTLITSDLVENFHQAPHWLTRQYLRLGGLLGQVGWHPMLRVVYRDRAAARASVDRLLEWPFERVVIAHGEPLLHDARALVREGMAWL